MPRTDAQKLLRSAARSGGGLGVSNMSGGLRVGGVNDLDGVRAEDGDHLDAGPGGQVVLGGDGLVLDGAVLEHEGDLAGAGFAAGDLEVDGAAVADRPVDAD